MMRTMLLYALAAAVSVAGVNAHHSIAGEYDSTKQVTVEGAVTAFRFVNPHPIVEFAVTDRAGGTQQWRAEMDNRGELVGVGMSADTLKPGDRIAVRGSASRNETNRLYVRSLERPADGFLYEQIGSSPRVRLPR